MEQDKKVFRGICSVCGKECELPFQPTEGRPIKCRDCFRNTKFNKSFNKKRRDFEVVCAECGIQTTVPFKPTQGRPVTCRTCFQKSKNS